MKYWTEYRGHVADVRGKRYKFDNTIYVFDIETSSYLILHNKQIPACKYLELTKDEQEECEFQSNMYIWQFSINDEVYYGRTWKEFHRFLWRIENFSTKVKKFIYVHNLSFEFQFMRTEFKFKNVFARKSRKVMKCELEDLNFEFRCSYMMTNAPLKKLPEIYNFETKKMVGDLDYSLIRNSKTKMTEKELGYCENDCLVVYNYIKKELETYKTLKSIPMTSTGHVRKELKEKIEKNYTYRNKVRKSINIDGHVYNLLNQAFAGGYTHANWIYTDRIVKNVTSFDFTSSYPYVMVSEKYPASKFKRINITKLDQLNSSFAYLIKIRFYNIKCKYFNNFISYSKCLFIKKGSYDNGRVIRADELEIVLTDVDLRIILETYNFENYEIEECYFSFYDYLPKDFINFILEKYENKTKYKNVKGKETEYALEKAKFNSLYGMSVTNNIKDEVYFDNILGWREEKITNDKILELLQKEEKEAFLSFSYGVWVTAYARYNLISNLYRLDQYEIYADTDSLKLKEGFDISIINDYNKNVIKKLKKVSQILGIDFSKFEPKDSKGKPHLLGIFDNDGKYKEFITQGAKKYAYKDMKDQIHITVSGVPKTGAKALKNLDQFRDDFVFENKDTNKNMIIYNDDERNFELTDYQGNTEEETEKCGAVLVPTTYELGKAEDYMFLITDESSKRAIFEEKGVKYDG